MRLISMLVAMTLLFSSAAKAEIHVIDQDTGNVFYGNFLASYDEESQRYWAMICVPTIFAGVSLWYDYRVYYFSHDMEDASFAFKTKHFIDSILATPEGLVYEREVYFNPMVTDVYYYDIQRNTHKRCVPKCISSLCGVVDECILYFSSAGFCSYNTTTGCESVIFRKSFVGWDDERCLYQTEDGSKYAYYFETGMTVPAMFPDHISRISNGYLLDRENMLLYRPDGAANSVPFIEGAKSVAITDGFLCALHVSEDTVTLSYISLMTPDAVVTVSLPYVYDRNLNICNGNALFYTKPGSEITVVNLSTATVKTVYLP